VLLIDLEVGQWIFFDVKMGYDTVHRNTGFLPPDDDVALFYGSHRPAEPAGETSTDLYVPITERERGGSGSAK
jgi:hypothetical protein